MSDDKKLNILTFNWHEPYICMMAGTGHNFLVIEPEIGPGRIRKWSRKMRPVPENVTVITTEEAGRLLEEGEADLAVCHNVKDLVSLEKYPSLPKTLVFHNKLTTELELGDGQVSREQYLEMVKRRLDGVELVFISRAKMEDWGLDRGEVILPGIRAEDYGDYEGDLETMLVVGNRLQERDVMMGFTEISKVCEGMPVTLLGENPGLNSRLSNGWDDLKKHYRHCRIYLHGTKHPYEDGYNLALLEAMATGMPVISYANPTSPVTDGEEGYISDDIDYLRQKAAELLKDPAKAKEMGQKARATVREKFPMQTFWDAWERVLKKTVSTDAAKVESAEAPARIWLDYTYYPATTAHYIRRAIEQKDTLVTSGSSITPEIIDRWNLEDMKAEIKEQDIPRSVARDARSIYERIPEDKKPEFFLWVDTGLEGPPAGVERLPIPKAAYFIDSHINLQNQLQQARVFDVVFLAQRAYINDFKAIGVKHVFWLPLACDPEVHGRKETEVTHNIGFVGSITAAHRRRKQLLEHLRNHGLGVAIRRCFLEDMAEFFSASRIVFNNAIKDDLNMRVFEALASGSMLLTDKADGLHEFFEDKKHLVIYEDYNIAQLARHYLSNDEERERIAKAGMEEVLAKHTYRHRVDTVIHTMRKLAREIVTLESRPEEEAEYYGHRRTEVADLVPASARRVLEVGCGQGETGAYLKEKNPELEVVGVEYHHPSAKKAGAKLDRVYTADVERFRVPYPDQYFDCIIYADVLEHLRDPQRILQRDLRLLAPGGSVVMSLPNIQHFTVINQLMEGRFSYAEEGILDRTHLRFFTLHEVRKMLEAAGLKDAEIRSKVVDDYYREGASGTLKIGRWQVDDLTADEMRGFFTFQYLVRAQKPVLSAIKDQGKSGYHPRRFEKLLRSSGMFDTESDDLLVNAGYSALNGDYGRAQELLEQLKEEETSRQRRLMVGHIKMVLGRFREAETVYEKLGDARFAALARAGRGDFAAAFSTLWQKRTDGDVYAAFENLAAAEGHPESLALTPLEQGEGARLEAGATGGGVADHGQDFISSVHHLEMEADFVTRLKDWRDRLKPGGIMGLVLTSPRADAGAIYPEPLYRFELAGLRSVTELVGGFEFVHSSPVLEDHSYLAVFRKAGGKNNQLNYPNQLRKMYSRMANKLAARYWEERRLEAARQAAETALELDPRNEAALARLGDCMQKAGDQQAAKDYYQKSLEIKDNENARIGLGTLCLTVADFTGATEEFETAIRMNPDNDRVLCGLGMARYHSGQREEGFGLMMNALAVNPENIPAMTSVLQAAYELERLDAAEEVLENYLQLHPANLDMLFGLAGVYYRQDKMEEANDVLEKLLILKPDHYDAESMQQKIKEVLAAK